MPLWRHRIERQRQRGYRIAGQCRFQRSLGPFQRLRMALRMVAAAEGWCGTTLVRSYPIRRGSVLGAPQLLHVRGLRLAGNDLLEPARPSLKRLPFLSIVGMSVVNRRYAVLSVVQHARHDEAGDTDAGH